VEVGEYLKDLPPSLEGTKRLAKLVTSDQKEALQKNLFLLQIIIYLV
jgi:hypothetical protein